MKRIIALIGIAMLLGGCQGKSAEPEPEHTTYIAQGRYYICGEVVTEDGNVWNYSQDIISERESYDYEPVFALIDDNGTPSEINDDEIYGVVLDRETEIYDELERELSKAFVVERTGNIISISEGNN